MARGRLTRDDWTTAALRALANGGVAAVSVDALAGELGITRGSFYWHFKDRSALLVAAMEAWEERTTAALITDLAQLDDPREKLRAGFLAALGTEVIAGLEPALMAQAAHPAVAPVLKRVIDRRISYLASLYGELGLTPAVARRQAVFAYSAYLGWSDLRRAAGDVVPEVTVDGARGRAGLKHFIEQLTLDLR
ncbi:TetR/AcrR family transcriptional regulator [Amycolatopsis sp. 195334CR]|uniref:TetR/AcrR family transcriptional regulator n=1 Tax=Amycolatopsis sp. 195334CR TaxID=2814588 RepID=UPI001A8E8975|nr:TetR/AcrR family transcriptional regulator [Amycolatopsis sp. 195334CR]MBN6037807.1 TetR/AcrR family transcriptional regulator [Amycolatopsis sp. 195334CR]